MNIGLGYLLSAAVESIDAGTALAGKFLNVSMSKYQFAAFAATNTLTSLIIL